MEVLNLEAYPKRYRFKIRNLSKEEEELEYWRQSYEIMKKSKQKYINSALRKVRLSQLFDFIKKQQIKDKKKDDKSIKPNVKLKSTTNLLRSQWDLARKKGNEYSLMNKHSVYETPRRWTFKSTQSEMLHNEERVRKARNYGNFCSRMNAQKFKFTQQRSSRILGQSEKLTKRRRNLMEYGSYYSMRNKLYYKDAVGEFDNEYQDLLLKCVAFEREHLNVRGFLEEKFYTNLNFQRGILAFAYQENQRVRARAQRRLEREARAKQMEVKQLEGKQLEVKRLEAKQLEAKQLEAKQLEAKQLEAKQLEVKRLEAKQLEVKQLEAKQLETKQLEARLIELQHSVEKNLVKSDATEYGTDITEQKVRDALSVRSELKADCTIPNEEEFPSVTKICKSTPEVLSEQITPETLLNTVKYESSCNLASDLTNDASNKNSEEKEEELRENFLNLSDAVLSGKSFENAILEITANYRCPNSEVNQMEQLLSDLFLAFGLNLVKSAVEDDVVKKDVDLNAVRDRATKQAEALSQVLNEVFRRS